VDCSDNFFVGGDSRRVEYPPNERQPTVIALPIIASIRQVQIAAGCDLYCATLQLLAKRSRSDRFWSVRTGSFGLTESNGIFARNLLEIEKFGDVD
jgi:hypothetical protein